VGLPFSSRPKNYAHNWGLLSICNIRNDLDSGHKTGLLGELLQTERRNRAVTAPGNKRAPTRRCARRPTSTRRRCRAST